MDFKLVSNYQPQGDQATAIAQLIRGAQEGKQQQLLLGVTGSSKAFSYLGTKVTSRTQSVPSGHFLRLW